MTAIDLSALSPEVTILGATTIVGPSAAVSSTPVTGFSDVATATVVVKVERVDNSNGEAMSVTVQQSDDGNSWTTAAGPYSFTREGTQTLAVDDPADRLRVTYSAARGVREATIGSVTARLGVVDAPTPTSVLSVSVPLTNAQIKNLPHSVGAPYFQVVASPGAGKTVLPIFWTVRSHVVTGYTGGDASYTFQLTAGAANTDVSEHMDAALLLDAPSDAVSSARSPFLQAELATALADQPLQLILGSNGGALGGGNAANTLTVTVLYTVIDV